jgi:enamine deaminase RidA (YjgF/YER057c/UK114 family)
MNGRPSARASTAGGKMLGKLFVSRVSACLFLLSFSSSQLITFTPQRRGNYFIELVKSLSPLQRGACSRMSVREPERNIRSNRNPLGKDLADVLRSERCEIDCWKGSAMQIERHETGPRMSKAVIHGDTVYLAGIVADNPKGKSTAEQTKSILSQIDGFLATAGTNKTTLLSTNIWITDMANFAEMNAVWDAWVSPGNTPARATVEAKLASPDYKVEIMIVAAR